MKKRIFTVFILAFIAITTFSLNLVFADEASVSTATELKTQLTTVPNGGTRVINVTSDIDLDEKIIVYNKGGNITINGGDGGHKITATTTNNDGDGKNYLDGVLSFMSDSDAELSVTINNLSFDIGNGYRHGLSFELTGTGTAPVNATLNNVNIKMDRTTAPMKGSDVKYAYPILVSDSNLTINGTSSITTDRYNYVAIDVTAKKNASSLTIDADSTLTINDNRCAVEQAKEPLIKLTSTNTKSATVVDNRSDDYFVTVTDGFNLIKTRTYNIYTEDDYVKAVVGVYSDKYDEIIWNIKNDITITCSSYVGYSDINKANLTINGNNKTITGKYEGSDYRDYIFNFKNKSGKDLDIKINDLKMVVEKGFRYAIGLDKENGQKAINCTLNNVDIKMALESFPKKNTDVKYCAAIYNHGNNLIIQDLDIVTDLHCYTAIYTSNQLDDATVTINADANFTIEDYRYPSVRFDDYPVLKFYDNGSKYIAFTDNRTEKEFKSVTGGYDYKDLFVNISNQIDLDYAIDFVNKAPNGSEITWNIIGSFATTKQTLIDKDGLKLIIHGNDNIITGEQDGTLEDYVFFFKNNNGSTCNIDKLKINVTKGFKSGVQFLNHNNTDITDACVLNKVNISMSRYRDGAGGYDNKPVKDSETKLGAPLVVNGGVIKILDECKFKSDKYCYAMFDLTKNNNSGSMLLIDNDASILFTDNRTDDTKTKEPLIKLDNKQSQPQDYPFGIVGGVELSDGNTYAVKEKFELADVKKNNGTSVGYDIYSVTINDNGLSDSETITYTQNNTSDIEVYTTEFSYVLDAADGYQTDNDLIKVFELTIDDGEWVKDKDLTINSDYTVASGSVLVTINDTYLNSMNIGTHKLGVEIAGFNGVTKTVYIDVDIQAPRRARYVAPKTGI